MSKFSSIDNIISKMKNSTPKYTNPGGSSSSGKRKRSQKCTNHLIEVDIYHFPGDVPLKKEYDISALTLALNCNLSVNDVMSENDVTAEVCKLLHDEFPLCEMDDFLGWAFFVKVPWKKRLKRSNFSSSTVFDGRCIRSLCSKDSKKIYLILTKHIPGYRSALPPRPTAERDEDISRQSSDSDSDIFDTPTRQFQPPPGKRNKPKDTTTIIRPQQPILNLDAEETPTHDLPGYLQNVPWKPSAVSGGSDSSNSGIMAVIHIFLHNQYFVNALHKAVELKLTQNAVSDFEIALLQFRFLELSESNSNVAEFAVKDFEEHCSSNLPTEAFFQSLIKLEYDETWAEQFFKPLLTCIFKSKFYNSSDSVEVVQGNLKTFDVAEESGFERRLIEVFRKAHFEPREWSEKTTLPLEAFSILKDEAETLNCVSYFDVVPKMLVLIQKEMLPGFIAESSFPQRKIEQFYSVSNGLFKLSALLMKRGDDQFYSLIIEKGVCLIRYGDKEFTVSLSSIEKQLYDDTVVMAIYDAVDNIFVHKVSLEDINTEVAMTIGRRLVERATVNSDCSTAKEADSPISTVQVAVEQRLSCIFGQEEVKRIVNRTIRHVHFSKIRGSGDGELLHAKMHMVFTGNPGVGKTQLARIMAGILFDVGVTKTPDLVEVQRADIVAQYIGQTAQRTTDAIRKANGGTLFVDEAYTLVSSSERDFGKEAIETIMAYLLSPTPGTPVFIFAGYRDEMNRFLKTNPGLARRIPHIINLQDYCSTDLAAIMRLKLHKRKMKFPLHENFAELFEEIPSHIRPLYNASLCDKLMEHAIYEQEDRLPITATQEELSVLNNEDFSKGASVLIQKLKQAHQIEDEQQQEDGKVREHIEQ